MVSRPKKHGRWISNELAGRIVAFLSMPGNESIGENTAAKLLSVHRTQVWNAKQRYLWGRTMKLTPDRIRRDSSIQPRAEMDRSVVSEYVEKMQSGVLFPPVVVYYDGTSYWLADGFHRVAAAIEAGVKKLDCEVKQGTKREAILFSVGTNSAHGLRRTNADKRRSVMTLLMDEEWRKWSDHEIAKRAAVAHSFVHKVRHERIASGHREQIEPVRTVHRNGTTYAQDSSGINRDRPPVVRTPKPKSDERQDSPAADSEAVEPREEPSAVAVQDEPSGAIMALARMVLNKVRGDGLLALIRVLANHAGIEIVEPGTQT